MASRDKNDCQLSAEARFTFFLKRWRGQLLIDETEGDADGIELDKRVLDYYLDQHNKLATFRSSFRWQQLSPDHGKEPAVANKIATAPGDALDQHADVKTPGFL